MGRPATATLTDSDDNVATPSSWLWEVDSAKAADAANAVWQTATGAGADTATYTPVAADLNRFMRVTAVDGSGPVILVTEKVTDFLVSNLFGDIDRDRAPIANDEGRAHLRRNAALVRRRATAFTTGDAENGYAFSGVSVYTDATPPNEVRVTIREDVFIPAVQRSNFKYRSATSPGVSCTY